MTSIDEVNALLAVDGDESAIAPCEISTLPIALPSGNGDGKPKRRPKRRQRPGRLLSEDGIVSVLVDEGRTELANAGRLVGLHGNDLRYCAPWGRWLVWDGTQWAVSDLRAEAQAKDVASLIWRQLGVFAEHGGDGQLLREICRFARATASAPGQRNLLRLAQSERGIPIIPDLLDSDPWLLNVANGTIELRSAELRPHRREDYLTKRCRAAYDPSATCPSWLAFQHRICADNQSLIDFKQRFYGMCLSGDVSEQILAIFFGPGANGKTTEIETMMGMLGQDYAIKGVSDLLMVKHGETHPTERADLYGKRLVAVVETEHERRLAESLVKELCGGDRIRARRMREDFWEFTPTHKLVIATNHKPLVKGTDHAIWRRIRLVPFGVTIPKAEQDPHLLDRLRAEYPGILAWCVRGCLAWQREGLGEPAAVQEATSQYRQSQDTLAQFLDDCCIVAPNVRARAGDLLGAYRKWSGSDHASHRWLGETLTERGFDSATIGGYVWRIGIGLKEEGM